MQHKKPKPGPVKVEAPKPVEKGMRYAVNCRTEDGDEVVDVVAISGDEAAAKAQAIHPGASVRGVHPR